jgi:hypothetical protein
VADAVGRAAARIRELATARQTGALSVIGQPGGLVFVVDGRVAYAESPATPGVEAAVLRAAEPDDAAWARAVASMRTRSGRDAAAARADDIVRGGGFAPLRLAVTAEWAVADALLAMLGGQGVTVSRTRFLGGRQPWVELCEPVTAGAGLAEVGRSARVLATLASRVGPDDTIRRQAGSPVGRVRLTAHQWDIVRLADGRRTPRDLSWLCGRSTLATTVDVHQLVELGVLGVTGRSTHEPAGNGTTPGPHEVRDGNGDGPVVARHRLSFLDAHLATVGPPPPPPPPLPVAAATAVAGRGGGRGNGATP